jgi:hypothetical protein
MGGGGSQQGGSQGGGYQKYLTQYAGDYSKYMGGGGSQQGGSQGGGYQKFMTQYAGKYMGGSQQGGSQQSVGTSSLASMQPLQFVADEPIESGKKDDDKSQDDKASASSTASDDEKEAAAGDNAKSGPAFAKKFLKQYAGGYMPHPKNTSDPNAWKDAFVNKYADHYQKYVDAFQNLKKNFPDAPATAADCHSLKQLDEWRGAATQQLQTYIPNQYQSFSKGAVVQQYKDNKARIEKEIAEAQAKAEAKLANASASSDEHSKPDAIAPMLLAAVPAPAEDMLNQYAGDYIPLPKNKNETNAWRATFVKHFSGHYAKYIDGSDSQVAMYEDFPAKAKDCHTLEDLKRWRDAQHHQVDTFIPQPYRTFGAGAVESQYAENKARIEQEMEDAAEAKASENANVEAKAGDDEKSASKEKDPSISTAAAVDSTSVPFLSCLAIAAVAAGTALAVALPRARRQEDLSEQLLTSEAPLAYVDVV